VPLPTNIQAEDIVKIINEAELTCLICSIAELPNLVLLVGHCETVKTFVVMDLPISIDTETHALMKKVRDARAPITLLALMYAFIRFNTSHAPSRVGHWPQVMLVS